MIINFIPPSEGPLHHSSQTVLLKLALETPISITNEFNMYLYVYPKQTLQMMYCMEAFSREIWQLTKDKHQTLLCHAQGTGHKKCTRKV